MSLIQKIPDFVTEHSGTVTAAYVTGPEILRKDNPSRRGVPFLFIGGPHAYDTLRGLIEQGVYYAPIEQFSNFMSRTNWSIAGPLPKVVRVENEDIPMEQLVMFEPERRENLYTGKDVALEGRIVHVSYAFGRHHNQDVQHGTRVRTREEYERILKEILPSVFEERQLLEGRLQEVEVGDLLFLHSKGLSVVGYVTGVRKGKVTLSRHYPYLDLDIYHRGSIFQPQLEPLFPSLFRPKIKVMPLELDLSKFTSYSVIKANDIPKTSQQQVILAA